MRDNQMYVIVNGKELAYEDLIKVYEG